MPPVPLTYFNFKKEISDSELPVAVLCISDEDRASLPSFERISKGLAGRMSFAVLNATTAPKLAEQCHARPSHILIFHQGAVVEQVPAALPAGMLAKRLGGIADRLHAKGIKSFK